MKIRNSMMIMIIMIQNLIGRVFIRPKNKDLKTKLEIIMKTINHNKMTLILISKVEIIVMMI